MPENDYSAFTDSMKTDSAVVANLDTLTDDLIAIDAEIANLEEQLKAKKAERRTLVENTIPNATGGIEGKFDLPNGKVITLKSTMRTSISAENKPAVTKWLIDEGHDAIIKCEAKYSFGKGERKIYTSFLEYTKEFAHPLTQSLNEGVHPQTLQAFVKEQLALGKDFPQELFGLYPQFEVRLKTK